VSGRITRDAHHRGGRLIPQRRRYVIPEHVIQIPLDLQRAPHGRTRPAPQRQRITNEIIGTDQIGQQGPTRCRAPDAGCARTAIARDVAAAGPERPTRQWSKNFMRKRTYALFFAEGSSNLSSVLRLRIANLTRSWSSRHKHVLFMGDQKRVLLLVVARRQ
jgi:hypothetical protein